jgi:hypothetical protein
MGYNIPYMEAELIFYRKNIEPDGDIVEMRIWKVPSSKRAPSGLKYSLVYIREGKRIVGYDNAEAKGHHRHYKSKEFSYDFRDVDNLIKDFYEDVERVRRGEL